ncbi:MAG: hypothetical protein H0V77_12005 [Actinobacteria bacterium]|nr:hypothetical protein [Actinomycetota bacterium]
MRVCLMIEGQEGVTWQDWVALAETCEQAGLEALFRSTTTPRCSTSQLTAR